MRNSTYAALTLNIFGYNNPKPLIKLKQRLDQIYFKDSYRPHQWFLTANGRTAIYLFLKSLNLPAGSQVITQSFTCVTAVNPILWAGLTPIYADIDPNSLSAAPGSLQSLITPQTKVIMLQHTFGAPAALKTVLALAKKHNLIVLEDCAHALGVKSENQPLGTFGDAAIISFGVEKTLTTKLGGALLVNNPDLVQSVETAYRRLDNLSKVQIFLWMVYPPLRSLIRKLPVSIEPFFKSLLEAVGLLKKAVTKTELSGGLAPHTLAAFPGVQAKVVLLALADLDNNLIHRQSINQVYLETIKETSSISLLKPSENAPQIKFPVICSSDDLRNHVINYLSHQGIYATQWYDPAIFPAGTDYPAINYRPDECPASESLTHRILNLPTGPNISLAHATMIANELNACAAQFARRNQNLSNSS